MKLPSNQTHIRVPISAIRDTGNVRLEYDEEGIRELAASIRRDGLINAVTVKPPVEDENGIKTYELIAGHRRIRALKYLCEQGDDFSMVECKILTGEMWALQMIENIQRTDLSSRDKEEAISYALSIGLSQTQIAEKLSKPIQYISDIVAGAKIRKIADDYGYNTENISTKAFSQLRSIPDDEIDNYIVRLMENGGTVHAATELLHKWQKKQAEKNNIDSQSNPSTYVSSEKLEQDDIDEQINGMFMDEADDVEYDEAESMIEPVEMTEAEFNKSEKQKNNPMEKNESQELNRGLVPLFKILEENQLEFEQTETKIVIKHFGKKIPVKNIRYDKKSKTIVVEADEKSQRIHCNTDQGVDLIVNETVTAKRLIVELSKIGPETPIQIQCKKNSINPVDAKHFMFYPDQHRAIINDFEYSDSAIYRSFYFGETV